MTSLAQRDARGPGFSFWRVGLAEVVDRNVEYSEEGVHIEHEGSVPFPSGLGGKPTLECGHLPLKFRTGNSHQAFKRASSSCWTRTRAIACPSVFLTCGWNASYTGQEKGAGWVHKVLWMDRRDRAPPSEAGSRRGDEGMG